MTATTPRTRAKTIGRGGKRGKTSGRGTKGQKARSGVSGLKRLGMKQMLLQVPKTRGFKSHFGKKQVVNFTAINLKFKSGELVNPLSLAKHGLIKKNGGEVKILSNGELTIDKLTFSKVLMSASAEAAVLAKSGKVPAKKIIPQKKKLTKKVK